MRRRLAAKLIFNNIFVYNLQKSTSWYYFQLHYGSTQMFQHGSLVFMCKEKCVLFLPDNFDRKLWMWSYKLTQEAWSGTALKNYEEQRTGVYGSSHAEIYSVKRKVCTRYALVN